MKTDRQIFNERMKAAGLDSKNLHSDDEYQDGYRDGWYQQSNKQKSEKYQIGYSHGFGAKRVTIL